MTTMTIQRKIDQRTSNFTTIPNLFQIFEKIYAKTENFRKISNTFLRNYLEKQAFHKIWNLATISLIFASRENKKHFRVTSNSNTDRWTCSWFRILTWYLFSVSEILFSLDFIIYLELLYIYIYIYTSICIYVYIYIYIYIYVYIYIYIYISLFLSLSFY